MKAGYYVMPRTGKGHTRSQTTTEPAVGTKAHSINQDAMIKREEALLEKVELTLSKSGKQFSIERLKALGATTFEGTTSPTDVEEWVNLVEKCFRVIEYPRDRKYAISFIRDEKDKRKHFKEGLRTAIRVPVASSANWLDFSKLVEAVMRVENRSRSTKRNVMEEKATRKEEFEPKFYRVSVSNAMRMVSEEEAFPDAKISRLGL
ncbi:uncharacterized protein E6C27_scaffold270G00690 [Cucumis melo var. makuwa]|uniref:Uncharacterized protein n=1 Tax=Cucumis melo var. makuwa TaxID=1194695 RepID=A0A5A7TA45_CUCMM|nr:uncharacterized protein E6C27_scaffold270G00690 [Cucumis melo var. makuwa]